MANNVESKTVSKLIADLLLKHGSVEG